MDDATARAIPGLGGVGAKGNAEARGGAGVDVAGNVAGSKSYILWPGRSRSSPAVVSRMMEVKASVRRSI